MKIAAFILYNLVLLILSPIILLLLLYRLIVAGKSRRGVFEQLGLIPARKLADGPRFWVHAVSVGENTAAKPVWQAMKRLLPDHGLIVSTTTDTGQATAKKFVGDQGQTIYFPFDLLPCVWLALARVRPEAIVIMETELWPNFLQVAKWFGCKIVTANGIISDHSLRGASRVRPIYRWMTSNIDRFCMQSQEDANRVIRLGADPARVMVTGNTKFDEVLTEVPLGDQITLRNALGVSRDEPILVAGSTHPGEEEPVLRAFRQVKTAHPGARLLIAPRHIQRAQEIEELAIAHGFAVVRRTKIGTAPAPSDAVIILDTLGELARAYALCTAAFVAGSFAPIGGHNVLEPLGLGKPAIFGPHMEKNRDLARLTLTAGVGFQVADADELAARWNAFLDDYQLLKDVAGKAKAIFQQNSGAGRRCADAAIALLGHTLRDELDV
ncbi:MAG: 3-deoxy-D-manno-octulosonic acid transferase [Armatimonadota bacterium]